MYLTNISQPGSYLIRMKKYYKNVFTKDDPGLKFKPGNIVMVAQK